MPNYLSPGVYVEEVDGGSRPIEGAGTAVAAFIGFSAAGPINEARLVTNWSQFVQTFGDMMPGSYLGLSVYNFFNNGGGSCYVIRIGGDGSGSEPHASAELNSGAKPDQISYRVEARESGAGGDDLSVSTTITAAPAGEGEGDGDDELFTIVVKQKGREAERHEGLSAKKGKTNVATMVNAASSLIRIEEVSTSGPVAERVPAAGDVTLSGGVSAAPAQVSADEYVGDSATRSGLGALEAIEGVTMVSIPDLMAAYEQGLIDLEGVQTVQTAIIDHCENMGDRMAILDPPPGLNAQQIKDWRVEKTGYDSKYATLYWPWIRVFDPAQGKNVFMPPSGAIAGVWGRNDDTRGVHKAPANEVVRGAIDIEVNVTRGEHDQLNPEGINVIRAFPGQGIRVWGARTLSSDPAWRYVNVRRLFNYLETSILHGTNWVVFEPNDLDLWQRIRRTISGFLLGAWRDGALFGATPDEAFYVKCDAETNPSDVVDAGQVICEIGIAPVKPAEFVVFRLSQFSGGADVNE